MKGQFVVPILLVLDISLPLLPKLWRLIVALHKSRFLQKNLMNKVYNNKDKTEARKNEERRKIWETGKGKRKLGICARYPTANVQNLCFIYGPS
jgi:hypothetical protein